MLRLTVTSEHVATPTSSPEPAHSTGSPPAVHQAPPPLTWGDAELPLDEERPEEHLETHPQPLYVHKCIMGKQTDSKSRLIIHASPPAG